nr:MAG TPA: hypothetical protein [Inoviridae sp.]
MNINYGLTVLIAVSGLCIFLQDIQIGNDKYSAI